MRVLEKTQKPQQVTAFKHSKTEKQQKTLKFTNKKPQSCHSHKNKQIPHSFPKKKRMREG
jgi:hypothetical protein